MSYDQNNVHNLDLFNTIKDDVSCTICMLILNNPKQCNKCENLFCYLCIESWLKKNKSCPYKCKDFIVEDSSRFVKNMLAKIEFTCHVCKNHFSYEKYLTHLQNCKIEETIKCPICEVDVSCTKVESYKQKIKEELTKEISEKHEAEIKKLTESIKSYESILNIMQSELTNLQNNNNKEIKNSNLSESIVKKKLIDDDDHELYLIKDNIDKNINIKKSINKIISFEVNSVYIWKGELAGERNLEALGDTTLMRGICSDKPGMILLELDKNYTITSFQVGGYNGKPKIWANVNGQGAQIYVSTDKLNWNLVGKIPSNFGNKITNIQVTGNVYGKYVRFNHTSYLGLGYFSINDPSICSIKSFNNKNINNLYNSLNYTIYEMSARYIYKEKLVGSENLEDLLNEDLTKKGGICLHNNGYVIFKMNNTISTDKIMIGGYNGDSTVWYSENGVGSEISVSTDGVNFVKVSAIPSGYGKTIKPAVFSERKTFNYLKFKCNSYLGISYLKIVESVDISMILATTSCIYSKIQLKNKYTWSGVTAGTNKVEDLLDNNPKTGVCSNTPGEIIIYLTNETTFKSYEVCGWSGNLKIWGVSNGNGAAVSTSKDGLNFVKVSTLPQLTENIATVNLESPTTCSVIKITSNSYLGLGVFKIISLSENKKEIFPTGFEAPKQFYNNTISLVNDINVKTSNKGICVSANEQIIFSFPNSIKISRLEVKGYTGNLSNWHPSQGMGSIIYTSNDKFTWTEVGSIPKTHGQTPCIFNVISTNGKFIKIINPKGYLGIGYFSVIQE